MTAARRICSLAVGLACLPLLASLAGCVSPAESGSDQVVSVDTVGGVGELPPSAVSTDAPASSDEVEVEVETSSGSTEQEDTIPLASTPPTGTVGQQVLGNKLLMIGDSLTASISKRYGGQACKALVPLGWQVEVDAETGRFIDFGKRVLDKRLNAEPWDAAVLFLGNNYGEDKERFQNDLNALILRLYPRPVVMITTTLFRDKQVEVNDAIRDIAANYDKAVIIDWEAETAEDPSLVGDDGYHLTEDGRNRLAFMIAGALGEAPVQPGKCLDTMFTDDSAGSPDGPGGTTKPPTTSRPPSTTAKPPTSSSTPASSSSSSSTSAPITTPTTPTIPPVITPPSSSTPSSSSSTPISVVITPPPTSSSAPSSSSSSP